MPTKKKTPPEQALEENAKVMEDAFNKGAQLPDPSPTLPSCGHINKQFFNSKGEREDLACTLPAGHEGDHFALFEHVVTDYGPDKEGRFVAKGSHMEPAEAWWSDAAGKVPEPVEFTREEDFLRLKAARDRERGVDTALSDAIDNEVKKIFNVS